MTGIRVSKGVNIFQNTPFKDTSILRWNGGREKNDAAFCI